MIPLRYTGNSMNDIKLDSITETIKQFQLGNGISDKRLKEAANYLIQHVNFLRGLGKEYALAYNNLYSIWMRMDDSIQYRKNHPTK